MQSYETNNQIWEEIYKRNDNHLSYPDDVLVRITHRLLDPKKHSTILDYGFGTGSNLVHLIKKGYKLSGVEVSDCAIAKLKERLHLDGYVAELQSNASGKIPFVDNSFDVVIAWQVLYYNNWDTFRDAMSEIERVLRPGGIFLGTMAAVGDYSHTHSIVVGDSIYRSTVPGQEGATLIILDEQELEECFPGRNLVKGYFGFQFGERHGKHWVISYEK
ncbi:class I SAM-dependent methyltransferase [Paenibacillus sp. GCM10027628]|uniref:class I SAM-dependent methyltransferase n=1 Tax=Paenibacillus sp. GCM10027628 TaxID=3273413 RepID=UPI0036256CEA